MDSTSIYAIVIYGIIIIMNFITLWSMYSSQKKYSEYIEFLEAQLIELAEDNDKNKL